MKVYTYTEARQKLASLLDRVSREGEARIKRRDGTEFVVRAVRKVSSPLSVAGVHLDLGAAEIVEAVREGRERHVAEQPDRSATDAPAARRRSDT